MEPFIGCGSCYPCRVGKSNCCARLQIMGAHRPGGYAEHLTAPAEKLHPVPKNLPSFLASFAEPVAIGVQACRRGEVLAGETVMVIGCALLGLALIEVARTHGARVWAADIQTFRWNLPHDWVQRLGWRTKTYRAPLWSDLEGKGHQ